MRVLSRNARRVAGDQRVAVGRPMPPIQYGMPQAEYDVKCPRSKATIVSSSGPQPPAGLRRGRHARPRRRRRRRVAQPRDHLRPPRSGRPGTARSAALPPCGRRRRAAGPRRCRRVRSRPSSTVTVSRSPCRSSVGAYVVEQLPHQLPRRPRPRPVAMSTASALQPVVRGPPVRGHRAAGAVRRGAGAAGARCRRSSVGDQRPGQRGDQHRVVEGRADVADPDLHGRVGATDSRAYQ